MAPKSKAKAKSQSVALTTVPVDAFKQLHNKLAYRKRAADTPEKATLYSEALVKLNESREEMLSQFAADQSLAWLPSLLKKESTQSTEASEETREWLNSYQMMEALGLRGFKLQDPFVQTELARHETKPHPNEVWRAQGVAMHRFTREVESSGVAQKSSVESVATATDTAKKQRVGEVRVNFTVAVKRAKQQLLAVTKNFEKQVGASRRLRTQCEFADAPVELQDRAEALRTSLADAEKQANARLDTWTVSRQVFIIFSSSIRQFFIIFCNSIVFLYNQTTHTIEALAMRPTVGNHTEDDLKQITAPKEACQESLDKYIEALKLAESQLVELTKEATE